MDVVLLDVLQVLTPYLLVRLFFFRPLCPPGGRQRGAALKGLKKGFQALQSRSFFFLPTVTARAQRPRTDRAVRVKKTGVLSPVSGGGGQFVRRVLQL